MVVCGILLYFILQHLGLLKVGTRKVLNILSPFVYGGIIAYLLDPLCNRIEDGLRWLLGHTKLKEKKQASIAWMGSILISLVLLLALIAFLLAMVLPQLAQSITRLVNAVPGYAADIYNTLLPLVQRMGMEEELATMSQELTTSVRNWATETLLPNMDSIITQVSVQVSGVVTGVFNVLVGFIVSFYCLNNRRTFALQGKKLIFAALPHDWAIRVLDRLRFADKVFRQ